MARIYLYALCYGYFSCFTRLFLWCPIFDIWLPFVPLYILYWAIIAAIFCGITVYQKHRKFDEPLHKLRNSYERVAKGDFTVYIEPRSSKEDYVDVIIGDLNKMVKELNSIETLKDDFISNVSHEIKTPLSIIYNYAHALKNKELEKEEQEDYLDTIITASESLSTLVSNVLKLSRIDNQELPIVHESYDVCAQLFDIAIALEKSSLDKDINFIVEIEDRLLLPYDPGMLELVWYNLLSNAVKFTPNKGTIILKQTHNDHFATISLQDSGIGMNEETIKRIYDKFYQGDTSHSTSGNGLGLALVKRIIDLVEGRIIVESLPNKGTTFTVELPL